MNDKISYLKDEFRSMADSIKRRGGDDSSGSGNPPGGNDLEARVEKLETAIDDVKVRLIKIEAKIDVAADHTATKADLQELAVAFHKSMNEQTWKFLSAAAAMSGVLSAIAFGVARLIK